MPNCSKLFWLNHILTASYQVHLAWSGGIKIAVALMQSNTNNNLHEPDMAYVNDMKTYAFYVNDMKTYAFALDRLKSKKTVYPYQHYKCDDVQKGVAS